MEQEVDQVKMPSGPWTLPALTLGLLLAFSSAWVLGDGLLTPGSVPPVGDVLAKFGMRFVAHVANKDELVAYRYGGTVRRDGYAVAGDGGAATYVHSAEPCSRNAGAGDGGWQVRDAAGTGCWLTDITKPTSVKVWGAKIDGVTDDLAAWNAAIAAMGSASPGPDRIYGSATGTIRFPSGNGACSNLSATLHINVSGVSIVGDNPHASCFEPRFATGNGMQIGDATHYPFDDNVVDIGFRSDAVHRTSGASLELFGDYNVNVSNITCYDYYYTCLGVDQGKSGVNYYLDRIHTEGGVGVFGISLGAQSKVACATPGICAPINVRLTRSELDGNGHGRATGAALNIVNVSGLDMEQNNTDFNHYGVWVHPGRGQYASGWYASDNAFDTSDGFGFFVDTTGGGTFTNSKFVNLWIASCGGPSNPTTCVLWQGPGHSIENITADWQVAAAFGHGVTINSGNDIQLSGTIAGNGIARVGTYHGLVIGTGSTPVSDLTWDGRIGGSAGADNVLPPDSQDCAIYIPAGAVVRTIVAKGDLSGNRHDPAVCDNSGARSNDYSGVVPGQPWSAWTPTVSCRLGGRPARVSASGRYAIRGKTVLFTLSVAGFADGACPSLVVSMPTAVRDQTSFTGSEMATGRGVSAQAAAGATFASLRLSDRAGIHTTGETYVISGAYESP